MRNSVVMNRMNVSGIHDQRYGIKDKYFWDCREQRASETFSVVCACFRIKALVFKPLWLTTLLRFADETLHIFHLLVDLQKKTLLIFLYFSLNFSHVLNTFVRPWQ